MTPESERDKRIGEALIELLSLRVKPNGRVYTAWGCKTPIGLTRTIKRVIEEES
jgi:hypothetical protein